MDGKRGDGGGGVVSDRGKKKKIKERGRESSDALSMMPCN